MSDVTTHWEVVPEHRDVLIGPEGLRLEEWLGSGQARVVKHGPHRTVYRIILPGLDCHLKHYRLHDTRAWLRELVRPSKARMEHERAVAVAARGVATITPLAIGEGKQQPGDSFLITRTLENVEPLNSFLETTLPQLPALRQTHIRQQLAAALGRFLATLHEAGIVHHDLHAGNLLLRLVEDRPELYLIDLHAVAIRERLGWNASRTNLILLNRWFILRASRSDRRRFWEAYCQTRTTEAPRHREKHREERCLLCASSVSRCLCGLLARDLEQATWRSNRQFWRSRDRRCLVNNRYYVRVRSSGVCGHAVRDLQADDLAPLLADPDAPFHASGSTLLKDSRSSTVVELDLPVNGVVRRVIWKRFRVTAWRDPWAALCRRSAALRSWVFGHGLRERLLPTPRPLAVLHRYRHGLPCEGYLLTEKVPNAVDLHRFVTELETLPAAERRTVLRHLLEQAAILVRELHHRQLSHRDLKSANILIQRHGPEIVNFRLWLIDLVGVARPRWLTERRRVQNLARLHASFHHHPALTRSDKLRFLRSYLQWGLHGRERWKSWWRQISEATQAKAARNARRGRPLV
jgi:tRNA A-37 threonylcarbamoyl transferase component Bud32